VYEFLVAIIIIIELFLKNILGLRILHVKLIRAEIIRTVLCCIVY